VYEYNFYILKKSEFGKKLVYFKFRIFWDIAPCVTLKLTNFSEVRTASIIIVLMMEAVHTSETSVNFNMTTWRYIPEDSKLHTRCRENLTSHVLKFNINNVIYLMYIYWV
jgi:hypothetical protein